MRSAILLVLVALVTYVGALRCGFVYDDHLVIERNRVVQEGSLAEIFGGEYWGTVSPYARSHGWRPLTILTLRFNHWVGELRPFGYHLLNVLLHAVVTLLVWLVARRFGFGNEGALAAGLLFAVHAVHTEAVTGIVGRAELLAAGGVLGALLLHEHGRTSWASVALAMGILSKENALIFPAIALVWDLLRRQRPRWRSYVAYAAVIGAFFLARVAVTGHLLPGQTVLRLDNPLAYSTMAERWLTAVAVLGRYVALLIAPVHMSVDYSLGAFPILRSPFDVYFVLGVILLLGSAWLLSRRSPKWPLACLAVSLWVLALLPVANLVIPIHTIMGERLVYLPSVGFCLLAGLLLSRKGQVTMVVLLLLTLGHAARAHVRNGDWVDDIRLFSAAQKVAPGSARVANNFGNVLKLRGDLLGAVEQYRRAARTYEDYVDAYTNLTMTLEELGRNEDAARAALDGARALRRLGYEDMAAQAISHAKRLDPQVELGDLAPR